MSQNETNRHEWVVIGQGLNGRTGPVLFVQCLGCGTRDEIYPTPAEFADYLDYLAEAGREWLRLRESMHERCNHHWCVSASLFDTCGGGVTLEVTCNHCRAVGDILDATPEEVEEAEQAWTFDARLVWHDPDRVTNIRREQDADVSSCWNPFFGPAREDNGPTVDGVEDGVGSMVVATSAEDDGGPMASLINGLGLFDDDDDIPF